MFITPVCRCCALNSLHLFVLLDTNRSASCLASVFRFDVRAAPHFVIIFLLYFFIFARLSAINSYFGVIFKCASRQFEHPTDWSGVERFQRLTSIISYDKWRALLPRRVPSFLEFCATNLLPFSFSILFSALLSAIRCATRK